MTLDKSPAAIRRMFAQIARRYDLLNHLLSLGIDRRWRRRTVRLASPPEGAAWILDVCTGTGDLALAYCQATGQEARVVGTDFCRPMLSLAEAKRRRARVQPRLDLLEADTLALPFPDGLFDIVCVAFGLRNVAEADAGLREMARVCRPGGQVAVLEFSMPSAWPAAPLYRWYFRSVLPRVGQAVAGNPQGGYNYLPASVGQFPQGEAMRERMRAAGLQRRPQPSVHPGHLHLVPRREGIMTRNIVVAITGASGVTYAVRLLEVLSAAGCNVHLVISPAAQAVLKQELDLTVDLDNFNPAMLMLDTAPNLKDRKLQAIRALAGISSDSSNVLAVGSGEDGKLHYYHYRDYLAAIASGSFLTDGMVICPCSSGTLSAIVHGTSANLIHRAAEVHIKERRRLILVPRETPLSITLLDNMKRAVESGAILLPAMPGFYHGVKSIRDLVDFVVARICDQLGIENSLIQRWGG